MRTPASSVVSEDSRTTALIGGKVDDLDGFAKPGDDEPPVMLGRYVPRRVLGQGGMGIVYAAYDPELRREVALKVLVDDGGMGHERMLREAQAMARLSHPNVVPVYLVGRDAGRPYLVMELVEGTTLSGWLRARPRRPHEVLDVFDRAGRGLAAAHAAGLIHRDFKPGNVLMASDGRVLVTDFGLARLAEHSAYASAREEAGSPVAGRGPTAASEPVAAPGMLGAGSALATLTGSHEAIGTPRYMAPEQHFGEAADASCDQYALCVSLYEALMGAPPFGGLDVRELARAKLDGLPRPLPRRRGVPRALMRVLARGLAPKPRDRFASMTELLRELQRARRARPRPAWLLAAALVPLAVVGSSAAPPAPESTCEPPADAMQGVWDPARTEAVAAAFATTGVPFASDAETRVRTHLDGYVREWAEVHVQACRHHEASRRAGEPAGTERAPAMACLDERRLELETNVDLLLAADVTQVQGAVTMVHAMTPPEVCLRATTTRESPDYRSALARVLEVHALLRAGRYGTAIEAAETIVRRLRAEGPAELLAQAVGMLGQARYMAGEPEAARERLEEAALLAEEQGQHEVEADAASLLAALLVDDQARLDEAEQWSRRAQTAIERGGLSGAVRGRWLARRALLQSTRGEIDASIESYAQAVTLLREALGPASPMTITTEMSHALALSDRGRMTEAEERLEALLPRAEQVFGPRHPQLALLLLDLGSLHDITGDREPARRLYERALAIWEASDLDLPNMGMALGNLGTMAMDEERFDEAQALLERAREVFVRAYGPEHVLVAGCHARLGLLAERRNDHERALTEYRTVLRMYEASLGPTHHDVAWAHNALGHALLGLSRHEEARSEFVRALAILADGKTDGHPIEGWSRHGFGQTLAALGQHDPAREQLGLAIDVLTRALGEDTADVARARVDLGELELRAGAPRAAMAPLQAAVASLAHQTDALYLARGRFALARALRATGGDDREAVALARQALDAWPTERAPLPRQTLERFLADGGQR